MGEVCPIPLLIVQSEIEKLNPGDKLQVETDFSQSVRNILKWCDDQGHKFDLNEVDNGIWQITIIKE